MAIDRNSIINDSPIPPGSTNINMNITYPDSDEYEYYTKLIRYNIDTERRNDILDDNGFIISPTNGIKKDMKDPNSIFSPKFGQSLTDITLFGGNKYKCKCGHVIRKFNEGCKCPACGDIVKNVGDNFSYTGWLVLKNHYYIHAGYYQSIRHFIGKDLDRILKLKRIIDEDGYEHDPEKPANQPYYGIGMTLFKEKFQEIMEFYLKKSPAKIAYYHDIMDNIDDVFTQSIPVFTTLLRPFSINQSTFSHEDTNATYTMLNKLVKGLNTQSKYEMQRRQVKPDDELLYDLQMKMQTLYEKIVSILAGKRGAIRTLFGGRCNFSGRSVIVAGPDLRIDEVTLPYHTLIILLQQRIINILNKSYGMPFNDAHDFLYKSYMTPNDTVIGIINSLIKEGDESGRGIPIIINRNPTINYGSILMMYCVRMTFTHTMSIPLPILPLLGADFDGDVLNILFIINKAFKERSLQLFNPRNTMYISRNDGQFNNDVNHQKDLIINTNTFIDIGKDVYTEDDEKIIQTLLNKNIS